jgi:exodeoxyribonuclease V
MNVTLAPEPPAFAPNLDVSTNPAFLALNQGQRDAAEEIYHFFFSKLKEIKISGPAGTGKTHLMKFIMQFTLMEYQRACQILGVPYIDYAIQLCATTNKAADVLAQATGFPAQTIHSFLGLKVRDNHSTGKSDITKTGEWKVHTKTIIFIDEASMIDTQLHRLIGQATDNTCKVIYLGDHCQMAPVFEKISPIYLQSTNMVTLTEQMRNSGQPALMDLCQQLRETTETLKFQPIQGVPGVIDYVDAQGAYDFVQNTFSQADPSARILVYSNARVQEYNQHVRQIRGLGPQFVAGERLVNNTALPIEQGDQIFFLPIEADIEILDSDPVIQTIHANNHPDSAFQVYKIQFRQHGTKGVYTKDIPLNPDRFADIVKAFSRDKNWERYFYLKNTFPDFRQRDACTVYKAQGSTYHTAFLDLTNIGTCKHNDQLARMLYVGGSRATTRLVLYGDLPKRLFI